MGHYDYITTLTLPEQASYLLHEANSLHEDLKDYTILKCKCAEQIAYINELEKQVKLLQKTLDVVNKNEVLSRKVRRCGRKR